MSKSILRKLSRLFSFALLFAVCIVAVKADDLTVEDIIAKHLNSIGTKEKRDAVITRMAIGTSDFESKLPTRKTAGKAVIVSDAKDLMFITSFASREYPFEKVGFFAGKVKLPYITAGTRSPLGAFINDHKAMLSDGLFAGSISSTWSLLNPQLVKEKLNSAGMKKIDGRKAYVLSFPTNSTEYTVRLYFDAENFQHLRSEYRHAFSGKAPTFGTLGTQNSVEIMLIEDFGDYKNENGLTLPHTYKIKYSTASNQGTFEYNWGVMISQYVFNQKLADDFFGFEDK